MQMFLHVYGGFPLALLAMLSYGSITFLSMMGCAEIGLAESTVCDVASLLLQDQIFPIIK